MEDDKQLLEEISDHRGPSNGYKTKFTRLSIGCSDGVEEKNLSIEDEVNKINPYWILISCGYMVSWTSIGAAPLP